MTDLTIQRSAAMLASADAVRTTFELMQMLAAAGALPAKMSAEGAITCAAMGAAFGWNPVESCNRFHLIQGQLAMRADVMVGIAKAHPQCEYFHCEESTDERAVYVTQRSGAPGVARETFTMADAKRADLMRNAMWKKYPNQMLRARCSAGLARRVYPDVLAGIYTPDEASGGRGATTVPDDDANVVDFVADAAPAPAPVDHEASRMSGAQLLRALKRAGDDAAVSIYWAAKAANDATIPPIESIESWPADNAARFARLFESVIKAGRGGAAHDLGRALGRQVTPADMAALEGRIMWADTDDGGDRARSIAAALLARRCFEKPETLHLRLGLTAEA